MREIKFRAWDTAGNQWLWITGFETAETSKSDGYTLDGIFHDGNYVGKEGIVLMQYTGLKDKNGREIYEGDIVLYDRNIHKDIDTAKFKVVWTKDRYVLQEIKHKYYIDDVTWELVEVIGNIYENPVWEV